MGGLATPLRCAHASSLLFATKPSLIQPRLASRFARLSLAINCVAQPESGASEGKRIVPSRVARPVLDINDKGEIYMKDVGGVASVGEGEVKRRAKPDSTRISVGVKKSSAVPRYSKAARRFYNETYRAESERLSKVLAAAGGNGWVGSSWSRFSSVLMDGVLFCMIICVSVKRILDLLSQTWNLRCWNFLLFNAVASRRSSEEIIFAGRVKVNGKVCTVPQVWIMLP